VGEICLHQLISERWFWQGEGIDEKLVMSSLQLPSGDFVPGEMVYAVIFVSLLAD
jgi:hypothetical protein